MTEIDFVSGGVPPDVPAVEWRNTTRRSLRLRLPGAAETVTIPPGHRMRIPVDALAGAAELLRYLECWEALGLVRTLSWPMQADPLQPA